MKENIPESYVVDHIDNNPLNNQHLNLRIVSPSENSRNKKKKENCTSKYIGVSKKENQYISFITINYKKISALYEKEIHAAHQYNLWIEEYNLTTAIKNIIETPTDFVKHVSKHALKKLPKGIVYNDNNIICPN